MEDYQRKSMIRNMKLAATFAAQSEGPKNRTKLVEALKDAGLVACVLQAVEGGNYCPAPTASGDRGDAEYWTRWEVYNLSEVKAYAEAVGEDWFDEPDYVKGEPCPSCGGYVDFSWRHHCYRCQECGNYFETEGMKLSSLAHGLTGWHQSYSGPGRGFTREPWAQVSRNRILITWSGGLDI